MPDLKKSPRRRKADAKSVDRFLEELSWLLSAHSDLDFGAIRRATRTLDDGTRKHILKEYAPKNPNVFFLVGALPSLFEDERLFANNEDIADFARIALHVTIPRWEKKSKFELIGHVVCNTARLSDTRVQHLVKALSRLMGEEKKARDIVANRRRSGLNWNEVIQKLLSERP